MCGKTLQATEELSIGCNESLKKTAFHSTKQKPKSQLLRNVVKIAIKSLMYLDNTRKLFSIVNQKNFASKSFSTFIW